MNTSTNTSTLEYRHAKVEEIITLRHDVLIAGTKRTSADFDGDQHNSTHHFGAFKNGTPFCCLSMMLSEIDGVPAYQLRGMATHPDYQRMGIGKQLLQFAENFIQENTRIHHFWCNARLGFEQFYQKRGWEIKSDPFMIENVCMHVRMEKHIKTHKINTI